MVDTQTAPEGLLFGTCELVTSSRQLYRDGKVCELEPKCFTLLQYLIEERHRTVPKDELIEKIWKTIHISDGVVARSVMKVRQVIDVDPEHSSIKTIHRIGYRFVGIIHERVVDKTTSEKPPQDLASPQRPRYRIAVLPFVNQTGDASLAWVELGLMALAQRSIAAAARSVRHQLRRGELVPVEDILGALRAGPLEAAPTEQARAVQSALGVEHFVLGVVEKEENAFTFHWTVLQPGRLAHKGVWRGQDLAAFALRWGESIMDIFSASAAPGHVSAISTDGSYLDEFLNQAHARAIQAFLIADYPSALKLLEVCRSLDRNCLRVNIDLTATLSRLGDARCIQIGNEILSIARAEGDIAAQVTILRSVRNFSSRNRQWDVAQEYAYDLEGLLRTTSDPDLRVQIQMSLTDHAWLLGQFNYARATAREILKSAAEIEDRNALAFAETILGGIDRLSANLKSAIKHLEQVDVIAVGTAYSYRRAVGQVELGLTYLHAGEFERGRATIESTLPNLHAIGERRLLTRAYHALCVAAIRVGNIEDAQEFAGKMIEVANAGPSLVWRFVRITKPLVSLALDDIEGAADQREGTNKFGDDALEFDDVEICQFLGHIIALPLRAREFAKISRLLDRARAVETFRASTYFEAQLLHAAAQLEHARGNVQTSRSLLDDAIGWLGSRDALWLVAMDQLWLAAETGDTAMGGEIHEQVAHILQRAWMGLATLARYFASISDYPKALELQDICLSRGAKQTERHDYLGRLHAQYKQALNGEQVDFERISFLPSVI